MVGMATAVGAIRLGTVGTATAGRTDAGVVAATGAGSALDAAGVVGALDVVSGENVAVRPKRASRVSIRCSSAACPVADSISAAGAWTTMGEVAEAGTDAGACDAGEALPGAIANAGVAVAGSDCTTA